MRFKIDENLPAELVDDLRSAGHESDTVADEGLTGSPDSVILETVRKEEMILLTLDKGIGDLRNYPPEHYLGIVLFRSPTQGRGSVLTFVRRYMGSLYQIDLAGHLVVVTESGVRIR